MSEITEQMLAASPDVFHHTPYHEHHWEVTIGEHIAIRWCTACGESYRLTGVQGVWQEQWHPIRDVVRNYRNFP